MTLIAIDPGPDESAFVRLCDNIIQDKATMPNREMLAKLRGMAENPCYKGTRLVIEQVASFGMAVGAEVFETVFWSGRFCQAWEPRRWYRVKRHEVKMHLCGSMRAKDANIRQALIDKLGPQGTKKNPGQTHGISSHCWAALAVGITFIETCIDKTED